MLAGASVCFDLSVFELFFPLTHGGAAVLAESALDLPRLPGRDAVRLAAFVPSTGAELLRSGGIPPGVRTLVLGGEALPPGLARSLLEGPGRRLFNAYGPTEATIYATLARIDAGETGSRPSAVRSRAAGLSCSTPICSRCCRACPGRSGSAAPGSPAAISAGRT